MKGNPPKNTGGRIRGRVRAAPGGKDYELAVIGSGPAGYAAAIYGARMGLSVLMVGEAPGGTILFTGAVENYPGFVSIPGRELARQLENHALDYDIDLLIDRVDGITLSRERFMVITGKKSFRARAVILATGARAKKLQVSGEKELTGNGVSYCAICDGPSFRGKNIALVGGGDSAVKEAVYAAQFARKVYVINNEKTLRSENRHEILLEKAIVAGKVEVINDNEVERIVGKDSVTGLVLKKNHLGNKRLRVRGVLIYIGVVPNSELARDLGVKVNRAGEVIVNPRCETNIPGCYAAGDVTNGGWRQAIIAVSQGATAAYHAYHYCRRI